MTFPKYPRDVSPLQNNEIPIPIPIELLEEILRYGWLSPMFMQERVAFMTSIALVSKTWLEVLIRTTYRDVYIPLTPYPFLFEISRSQLCRTITRQIPLSGKMPKHSRLSIFQGKRIQNMLSTFHGLPPMPNLQTLTVEYYNTAHGRNHFFPIHAPIVQVQLEYTFASDCPRWLIDALLVSRSSTSKHLPWALPHLEHVSTPANEDPDALIAKVLDSCPHLQLAEERFTVGVHILSSSRCVPENCTIFHGVMPSSDACVMDYHDFEPNTVRGSALALVLIKGGDSVCGPSVDLTKMSRNVHVFVHKNG